MKEPHRRMIVEAQHNERASELDADRAPGSVNACAQRPGRPDRSRT